MSYCSIDENNKFECEGCGYSELQEGEESISFEWEGIKMLACPKCENIYRDIRS